MVTVPYIEAGQAAFDVLDTYNQNFLHIGEHPRLASFPMKVEPETSLLQFAVVGVNAGGNLVMASLGADSDGDDILPVGVLTQAVTAGPESDGDTTVPVWYSGHFGNIDALVWHDDFDTDQLKLDAFKGSPTPTTVVVAKRT